MAAVAGRFMAMLNRPKAACKPQGDHDPDPIPHEWGLLDDIKEKQDDEDGTQTQAEETKDVPDDDKEEEEWRASTAAMDGAKRIPSPTSEEAAEEAAEEAPEDATDEATADQHEDEEHEEDVEEEDPPADDPPGGDDLDDQAEGHEGDDDDDDDDNDQGNMNSKEYWQMDGQMKDLKKFVEGEHSKTPKDDHRDHQWQNKQYRNKGNYGYKGNNKTKGWKYGKGRGWHSGKSKGKGKWNWSRWNSSWDGWSHTYHGDQGGWQNNQAKGSTGSTAENMLIPDRKGKGYYLPNQQGFLDNEGKPGEGLQGKTRTRGGAKAQAQKRKAEKDAEELEAKRHQRQMMDRLAGLAEKALDKF
eukprot:s3366_g3.t1